MRVNGSANSTMMTVPTVPAKNEPTPRSTAPRRARPFARHLVAVEAGHTDADSPGRLTRIEVVEPPYCAP